MDHTRDNPLKRFTAFWIALLMVTSFGIALIIFQPFAPDKTDKAYEAAGEARLKIKEEIDRAQDDALNEESLEKALKAQAESYKKSTESKGGVSLSGAAPVATPAETPAE